MVRSGISDVTDMLQPLYKYSIKKKTEHLSHVFVRLYKMAGDNIFVSMSEIKNVSSSIYRQVASAHLFPMETGQKVLPHLRGSR